MKGDGNLDSLYAWTFGGKQRRLVLCVLEQSASPTEVAKLCRKYNGKISVWNASDVLRKFVEKGIAVCINPSVRVGRAYALTDTGKALLQEMMRRYGNPENVV